MDTARKVKLLDSPEKPANTPAPPSDRNRTGWLGRLTRGGRGKSNARFKPADVLESCPDAIISMSLDGVIAGWNPAAERLFGWPAEEAVGKSYLILFPPDRSTEGSNALSRAVHGELIEHPEAVRLNKDQQSLIIAGRISAVRDRGGKIIGICKTAREITAQKRKEDSLRKSASQLRSMIENAPACMAMLDRDLHYMVVSRRWAAEYGRGLSVLAGLPHYKLVPDLPQSWKDAHTAALAGQSLENSENCWIRADGTVLWLRRSVQPWQDENGRVGGIIISTEDITQRKRAEEQLRKSEEKFRQLAENINDVFWMTDAAKQQMLYISPAYTRIWGRSCESLYASPLDWIAAIHPEDRERVLLATRTRQAAGTYDEEYRIVRPDEQTRWIRDRAFPIHDESGAVHRIVGIAKDITDQRRLEEQVRQSQKLDGIGRLAGGVAHDFNNLLSVFQMQADSLRLSGGLTAEQLDYVREIAETSRRGSSLTRQLLLFSRREVIHPRELDLSEGVTGTVKMLKRILGEDIEIQLHLATEPMTVHADPGMMDQLLMNLVVNARDAMPQGGRVVIETSGAEFDETAAAHSAEIRAGAFVRLSVSDTGCGIPRELISKIFEPFFTTKEAGKGTGLGLATVFGIVQQHQGWITVYSEPGHGTTFRVYLPRRDSAGRPATTKDPVREVHGGSETILLVEDDRSVRVSLQKALSRLGYRVLEAATGATALTIWREHRQEIRLVVTDLLMPDGMTGRDVATTLAEEEPQLPVLFMSGYSAEVAGKGCVLDEGFNFLTKPFSTNKLAQLVREKLDARRN